MLFDGAEIIDYHAGVWLLAMPYFVMSVYRLAALGHDTMSVSHEMMRLQLQDDRRRIEAV